MPLLEAKNHQEALNNAPVELILVDNKNFADAECLLGHSFLDKLHNVAWSVGKNVILIIRLLVIINYHLRGDSTMLISLCFVHLVQISRWLVCLAFWHCCTFFNFVLKSFGRRGHILFRISMCILWLISIAIFIKVELTAFLLFFSYAMWWNILASSDNRV